MSIEFFFFVVVVLNNNIRKYMVYRLNLKNVSSNRVLCTFIVFKNNNLNMKLLYCAQVLKQNEDKITIDFFVNSLSAHNVFY